MRLSATLFPALLLLVSCNGQGAPGAAATPTATMAPNPIIGTPAPGSKLARLRIGMGKQEVQDLIGEPSDQNAHITGKVFIPFYFGGGTSETDAHYKGEGILTYASRSVGCTSHELISVAVDRRERGYVFSHPLISRESPLGKAGQVA